MIDAATVSLTELIGQVVLDVRVDHLRFNATDFIEFVTYMTVKLG